MKWVILLLAIASNALASIVLREVATSPRRQNILVSPIEYASSPLMWLALFFYGLSFVMYTASLQNFPLHFAHPVVTVSAIISVTAFSLFVLRETLMWSSILGILLIVLGVVLLAGNLKTVDV